MKYNLEIGDVVDIRVALLFQLERFLTTKLQENPDTDYRAKTIAWGRESFSMDEAGEIIISFIEPPKPAEVNDTSKREIQVYEYQLFIQGMINDDSNRPTLPAYMLVSEIKRLLFNVIHENSGDTSNILNLGPKMQSRRGNRNNIFELKIGAETVRGPGEHSRFTYFWLPVVFSLAVDLKSPRVTIQNPL